MPPRRPRRISPAAQGLSAGEKLKRIKLSGNEHLAWSWVGTEVTNPADITLEHRLATCGFSDRNRNRVCANKHTSATLNGFPIKEETVQPIASGELEDDIIVVPDDESLPCDSKTCRSNPNCLNYLGQEKWQNESIFVHTRVLPMYAELITGKARDAFFKAIELGTDPTLDSRASGTPIGLKVRSFVCVKRVAPRFITRA